MLLLFISESSFISIFLNCYSTYLVSLIYSSIQLLTFIVPLETFFLFILLLSVHIIFFILIKAGNFIIISFFIPQQFFIALVWLAIFIAFPFTLFTFVLIFIFPYLINYLFVFLFTLFMLLFCLAPRFFDFYFILSHFIQ